MSIERFLAIYFPVQTKTLSSSIKVILTMVITFTFTAALNIHFFWTYELKKDTTTKYCGIVSKYSVFLGQYWPWITMSFYSLIPFTILISTSTAIILKIVHSNYVRKHTMNINNGGIKTTSMTLTLFAVSFVFLTATGPAVVWRYAQVGFK